MKNSIHSKVYRKLFFKASIIIHPCFPKHPLLLAELGEHRSAMSARRTNDQGLKKMGEIMLAVI